MKPAVTVRADTYHEIAVHIPSFPAANAYAVAANGQRFLVAEMANDPSAPPISVVVNWTALFKR